MTASVPGVSELHVYAMVPHARPEVRLAFLGCHLPEPRVQASLDQRAADALAALRDELLDCLKSGNAPRRDAVQYAADAVSVAMAAVYGNGAMWWRMPRESSGEWQVRYGLDVPTCWGLAVALGHFDRLHQRQRGAPMRRSLSAMNAAAELRYLMDDWGGFWRPAPHRDWATSAQYRDRWARYLRAEAKAGGLQMVITSCSAPEIPVVRSAPLRLVYSRDA